MVVNFHKNNYDFIFSTPTYKSVNDRLLKYYLPTLKYLDSKILVVIISRLKEDTDLLIPFVEKENDLDIVLFEYDSDSIVREVNWTLLWARNNGISSRYYSVMPDDMEFIECVSNSTKDLLDVAFEKTNYCIATFNTGVHNYGGWGQNMVDNHIAINPYWIDIPYFMRWEDVFSWGMFDGPVDCSMSPFFISMEYVHRARILSGRPAIIEMTNNVQFIQRRGMPDIVTDLRSNNSTVRIDAGIKFWETKYGMSSETIWDNPTIKYWVIYDALLKDSTGMKRHISINDLWDDYDSMYNLLEPNFRFVTSNVT